MEKTVLILGANGRFGRHAKAAFSWADWNVICFDRTIDQLPDAAWGAELIVNAWNPAYPDWASHLPKLTAQIIATARETGATVLLPGNVYNFGRDLPEVLSEDTPHNATSGLPLIRKEMEDAYRDAGVKTIVLRAGDFIDTGASGNWFDQIITAKLQQGKMVYPGNPDAQHAWAYLPDLAQAAMMLAEKADDLETFTDVAFPGYTLSGQDLTDALSHVLGDELRLTRMSWLPIQIARPFWKVGRHLLEMRYLWNRPHRIVSTRFAELLPDFAATDLHDALESSLPADINPNREVTEGVLIRATHRPVHAGALKT